MCMQCSAAAEVIKQEVLPGITLMRSTKDVAGWPLDWYGLVESNDPLFVFQGPLCKDPCVGLTEDDLNSMPEFPEGYDEFSAVAAELSNVQISGLVKTHEFVQTCMASGYNPKQHGYQLGYWLAHHLAQQLEGD